MDLSRVMECAESLVSKEKLAVPSSLMMKVDTCTSKSMMSGATNLKGTYNKRHDQNNQIHPPHPYAHHDAVCANLGADGIEHRGVSPGVRQCGKAGEDQAQAREGRADGADL